MTTEQYIAQRLRELYQRLMDAEGAMETHDPEQYAQARVVADRALFEIEQIKTAQQRGTLDSYRYFGLP